MTTFVVVQPVADRLIVSASHPSDKNRNVARVGHPHLSRCICSLSASRYLRSVDARTTTRGVTSSVLGRTSSFVPTRKSASSAA